MALSGTERHGSPRSRRGPPCVSGPATSVRLETGGEQRHLLVIGPR